MKSLIPFHVRLLVLACLKRHDRHYCFGIARWIRTEGGISPPIAQVWRECDALERMGCLKRTEAHPDDRIAGVRKMYYQLTDNGRLLVKAEQQRLVQSCEVSQRVLNLLDEK